MRKILLFVLICSFFAQQNASGQCTLPSGQFATAAFATGGSSVYKNNVLWLTWGAQVASDTYGKHNQTLNNGSSSYASINMGGGRYLCIQATISNLVGLINSYAPGNYSGDSMDDMYNIGGTGSNNKLVSGIRNTTDGASVSFTLTCKATIDGVPVRLNGMVLGDAESLASRENFTATASGTWSIVDLKKNTSSTAYEVRKDNLTGNKQKLSFLKGNDNNTGAVAFLTFNEQAFQGTDLSVSFDVTLKGGGLTAISLGLLPPAIDGGDAPESYGTPLHMIDALNVKYDNIPVNTVVNLNTTSYQVGGLETATSGFLGTTGPDADNKPLYSKDAMGDNNDGIAGVNEEDAWPAQYKSFSYKLYYNPNQTISVAIPYKAYRDGYIAGWIDFNQNGVFDASERSVATAPASGTTVNLTWTVPQNRVIRSTYVRLRYGYNLNELQVPTGSAVGGEVEDHRIFIQGSAITNPMLPGKGRK